FSSRRRHTRFSRDWSSDVCSSDLFSSLLITVSGITGWFQRLMQYMPRHIAAAMLAGILIRFGMDLFVAMQTQWLMVGLMFMTFKIGRASCRERGEIVVDGVALKRK